MTNDTCKPCEVDELQAWKCMMDSMVKFIQASTKLMNTFNEKSSPQIEDLPNDCGGPCKLQLSLPPKEDCKAPCNLQEDSATDDVEERLCHEDCTAYNPQGKPKCKKCDKSANDDENEPKCSPECDLCLPSRAPICKKCDQSEEKEKKLCHPECNVCLPSRDPICNKCGSQAGEQVDRRSQTAKNCPCPKEEVPKQVCICTKEDSRTEDTQTEEEKGDVEEVSPEGDENPPAEDAEPEAANEETNVTEEDPTLTPENVDEGVQKVETQKEGTQTAPDLVDCGCQSSESKKASDSSCNCEEKWKEERENAPVMCSCPLSSEEKLEMTSRMQEKLEIAQEEINKLRKEIEQLQFSESTKHTNSAALYKEIMKESVLDKTFDMSGAQRSRKRCCESLCSSLRKQFSVPQQPTFNRERSFKMPDSNPIKCPSLAGKGQLNGTKSDPASRKSPVSKCSQSGRFDRSSKFNPMASSSLAGNDLLNGTKSDPASRQGTRSSVDKSASRCNDVDNTCIRRNKQQRRSKTVNKTAANQTFTNPPTPGYGGNQRSMNPTMTPQYCCSQLGREEEQECDCSPNQDPYTSQDVGYAQNQNWPQQGCGYNTQDNYINDNYNSDDESCDDTYSCGNKTCSKYRG